MFPYGIAYPSSKFTYTFMLIKDMIMLIKTIP